MDKEAKRLYDIAYRRRNKEKLSVQRKEKHLRTYDKAIAHEAHASKMQDPYYRNKRLAYSRKHESKQLYGYNYELGLIIQLIKEEVYQTAKDQNIDSYSTLYKRIHRRKNYVSIKR